MKNFRSVGNATDAASRVSLNGKLGVAATSGLLIGCLLAVGCSKKEKATASETQTSANQMTLNQPVMPSPVAQAETLAPTPAPRKVTRKRKATLTYSDQAYGVSFRYPWQYSLKMGNQKNAESAPMDFVQPGGVTAVSVEVPKGYFPETDFYSASFRVNVNKNLTEAECGQFALPQQLPGQDAVQPSNIALGGLEMQEMEDISGETTKQADTKYYHSFQNGACYEFALGFSTEDVGDDETLAPVNRDKVFQRLETVLATVKIKPDSNAQVLAGTEPTPAAQ